MSDELTELTFHPGQTHTAGYTGWAALKDLGRLALFARRNRESFGISSLFTTLRCCLRSRGAGHVLLPVIAGRAVDLYLSAGSRISVHGPGPLHLGIGRLSGISVRDRTVLDLRPGARLMVDGDVKFVHGSRISVGKGCVLAVGRGTSFGGGTRILVRERIAIGARCAISWNVTIMDTDFHSLLDPQGTVQPCTAPISIGNHVWIGAEAMILKGVSIGDDAIVAARSLVTTDVPAGTLVAGQPAKILRRHHGWQ